MRRKIIKISIAEVEYSAFRLAKELMSWNEPIPDFGSRFPNVLESCISTPFQTYSGKSLYRKLSGKAAILFYLMIKNHPFENGNKRIAVMTLLLFLARNDKWLNVNRDDLYHIAIEVAKSNPKNKEKIIKDLNIFLEKEIVDL